MANPKDTFRIVRDSNLNTLVADIGYIQDLHTKAPLLTHQPDSSLPNGKVLTAGTNINFSIVGDELIINSSGGSSSPGQIIYVRQNGSDITGNGTIESPYASITHAMSTITDAAWEKRYVIDIGPGNWADNFSWKAWVFCKGNVVQATRLTGSININDPSWSIPGSHSDARAGAQDIAFTGTLTLDWSLNPVSPGVSYGKFYFWNCNVNNNLTMIGINIINQVIYTTGFLFGGMTISGVNVTTDGISGQTGTFLINSAPTQGSLTCFGGGTFGNLTLNYTVGAPISATLIDQPVLGAINISGAQASLSATDSSLPVQSQITLSGGATLTRLTDAYSMAYTPTNPAQWATLPTSLTNAIDRLASAVYVLRGNVPIL